VAHPRAPTWPGSYEFGLFFVPPLPRQVKKMDLNANLERLERLQDLEEEIELARKDKQTLYLDIEKQREKVQELVEERQKAKEDRQRYRKEADERELKVKAAEEENEKLKVQRNTTKNNAQFQAMGQSIAGNLADIEKWEDEELELLDQADKMKQREARIDRKIEKAREKLEKVKERVAKRVEQYEEEIQEQERKRQTLREEIAPKVLNDYDRLARSRGKTALVKAKKRVCQGCFTTLTKQTENMLLKGEDIVHCHNCGRMLTLNREDAKW
jgi:hypothetical protein